MNLLPYRISNQVPEFVREDHPAFVEFIKAYYKWMSTQASVGKLGNLIDIDQTVDSFVQYFRQSLDINGILANTDNRTYLKHIKELYTAKGSEEGYEFLFKILFNKGSSVIHPWDYTFKLSQGEWHQDVSILVEITAGNVTDFVDNHVEITDQHGKKYTSLVINATTRPNGVVEMFIPRFAYQSKLISVSNLTGTATGTILTSTTATKIEKAGAGFQLGQLFLIDSFGGTGTLIKIKSVDSKGGIQAVDIISFGEGYTTDFNILITPSDFVDVTELGSRIQLGNLTYDTNDDIKVQRERGIVLRHDYTSVSNNYFNDPTYVGKILAEIKSHPDVVFENLNYASIKFTVGQLCVYPGYYDSSNNVLGDLAYVQDSFYYQAFSYVTSLEESLDKYATILKKVLHPAGTKHFGEYQVFNQIGVDLSVVPSLNFIVKADAIREFMSWVDQLVVFFSKVIPDTDSVTSITDLYDRIVQFYRTFTETVTPEDGTKWFDVSIVKDDPITTSETVSKDAEKALSTPATITELFQSTTDFIRSTTETVTASDATDIVPMPMYTDTATVSDSTFDISAQYSIPSEQIAATEQIALTFNVATIAENVTVVHATPVLEPNKYITDTVVSSMSGDLRSEPYYVVYEYPGYWQAGYLENETTFTN